METLPIKLEPIVEQIKNIVPRMERGRDKAMSAMQSITAISNDEELAAANTTLVAVRNTFEAMQGLRMPITKQFDEAKQSLMQYEKDLEENSTRVRSLIGSYNQQKLDANRKAEADAQKQKEKENHKVDIAARIKKKLADLLIERVRQVQTGSKDFFDNTTLKDFDSRANQFKNMKPRLKDDQYAACFVTDYNRSMVSEDEYNQLIKTIQTEETYDKWNVLVMNEIVPKLNEWIGRIPEIKQNLVDLENAKNDEVARKAIEDEQKRKAKEEEEVRQRELAEMQKESDANIQREADVDKLQNDFREQAITQTLEDAGPVKLVAKFKDDKPVKALCEMIYHCFSHPKFPSIVKKNKDKTDKINEGGMPEYVDGVDYFLTFFLKNCDVNIQGIEVKEISKVIVRK